MMNCSVRHLILSLLVASRTLTIGSAFAPGTSPRLISSRTRVELAPEFLNDPEIPGAEGEVLSSRRLILAAIGTVAVAVPSMANAADGPENNKLDRQFVQEYGDFIRSPQGFSYREVSIGKTGEEAQVGDRVVFDWSGYTIGYFGRPFQAKGGPQGGAFDKDLDYARTVIGSGSYVKGLEDAFVGMRAGGVRQVLVPYGPLSYPADDPQHDRVGPKPSTFSGERALDFVLENPRLDRTLLFNVKVIRVDKPNGKGGFSRG